MQNAPPRVRVHFIRRRFTTVTHFYTTVIKLYTTVIKRPFIGAVAHRFPCPEEKSWERGGVADQRGGRHDAIRVRAGSRAVPKSFALPASRFITNSD